MKLSSRAYDIIKFLCTRLLPAAGTLYFALSQIWNWPYAEAIVGTITAICTFLGEVMAISSDKYYKEEQDAYEQSEAEDEELASLFADVTAFYHEGDENLPEELTEEELKIESELFK